MTGSRTSRPRWVAGTIGAASAAAALVLTGCGTADQAAVVDGRVVSETLARDSARQINDAYQPQVPVTTADVVRAMILVPTVVDVAAEKGINLAHEAAATQIPGISDPTDYTVDLYRVEVLTRQLGAPDHAEIIARTQAADIVVNPRYGTFDAANAALTPEVPGWISDAAAQ